VDFPIRREDIDEIAALARELDTKTPVSVNASLFRRLRKSGFLA